MKGRGINSQTSTKETKAQPHEKTAENVKLKTSVPLNLLCKSKRIKGLFITFPAFSSQVVSRKSLGLSIHRQQDLLFDTRTQWYSFSLWRFPPFCLFNSFGLVKCSLVNFFKVPLRRKSILFFRACFLIEYLFMLSSNYICQKTRTSNLLSSKFSALKVALKASAITKTRSRWARNFPADSLVVTSKASRSFAINRSLS